MFIYEYEMEKVEVRRTYTSAAREWRGMSRHREVISIYSEEEILTVLESEIKLKFTSVGKNMTWRK